MSGSGDQPESSTSPPSPHQAALSARQQAILDLAAECEAATGEDTSHERIHVGLAAEDDEQTESLIQSLMPKYLRYQVASPYQTYRLTKEGWLHSKYGPQVAQLIAGTLSLLREKLAAQPDFRSYTWGELTDRGLSLGFEHYRFAQIVLGLFGLFAGGGGGNWGRPLNILKLAKLRTLDELERYREAARAKAEQEEAAMVAGDGGEEEDEWSDSPQPAFDSFGQGYLWADSAPSEVSVNNFHFYSGPKIETTHNATISNATIGAFSQGGGAQATAGPGAGVAASDFAGHEAPASVPVAEPTGTQPAAVATYSAQIQGSTASAQGPGAQATGTVNYILGPSESDIRTISREVASALREAVGQARDKSTEDMLRISFAVVRGLVAAKLGAETDDVEVARFLREAVEDPAFPARAVRLFQEGAKTPSPVRREMLARALFGIPASTPERDRVDAAIERLFPDDVRLLRELVALVTQGQRGEVALIKWHEPARIYAVLPGTEHADPTTVGHVICPEWPLHSLQVIGCVSFGPWLSGLGPDHAHEGTGLEILPLGHAVLKALVGAGNLGER